MPPDLASFRTELRRWLSTSFPKEDGPPRTGSDRDPERHRHLQRLLFEGGFAGLTYPVAYGGRGLSPSSKMRSTRRRRATSCRRCSTSPSASSAPPSSTSAREEQKRRHLPAILRGDELWVQLLSEPASGSDLAGCITRATRDGDQWILNGSKIWSTGAHFSDYALCLARSNWSLPKHRGLTMYIAAAGAARASTLSRSRQANGDAEFCQEFITDVAVDATATLGEENAGWQVASRLLYHERNLAGAASPYTYGFEAEGTPVAPTPDELRELALSPRHRNDSRGAGAWSLRRTHSRAIQAHLVERINGGITRRRARAHLRVTAPPLRDHQGGAVLEHQRGDRRRRAGGRPDRSGRLVGRAVPHAPGRGAGGREYRDAAQHHRGAGPRPPQGAGARRRRSLRLGAAQRAERPPVRPDEVRRQRRAAAAPGHHPAVPRGHACR